MEMQKGHLTIIDGQKKEMAENAVATDKNQLKRPPSWLIDDVAKKEWKRVVKELENIGIVGNLDVGNIGGYCNAFSSYTKATEELRNQPYCFVKETSSGTSVQKNPLVNVQKLYAEEMRKFASNCGLTIDSRLKAGAAKVEKQENDIEMKFGAI